MKFTTIGRSMIQRPLGKYLKDSVQGAEADKLSLHCPFKRLTSCRFTVPLKGWACLETVKQVMGLIGIVSQKIETFFRKVGPFVLYAVVPKDIHLASPYFWLRRGRRLVSLAWNLLQYYNMNPSVHLGHYEWCQIPTWTVTSTASISKHANNSYTRVPVHTYGNSHPHSHCSTCSPTINPWSYLDLK